MRNFSPHLENEVSRKNEMVMSKLLNFSGKYVIIQPQINTKQECEAFLTKCSQDE